MKLANQALARATIPRTKEGRKLRNVARDDAAGAGGPTCPR
ncbi:hypothetical protein PCL1606_43500 [Pseudomonas chlororaphis]|uniref:Uncharacterized protein n=1 Tax=Pseudomonas chlororaphis TaxID=587753 RepID=A0A0D5Y480_9PSED|nr:hypothetical protein PCL1606_43500 [Pseudomonas chlororaphis]